MIKGSIWRGLQTGRSSNHGDQQRHTDDTVPAIFNVLPGITRSSMLSFLIILLFLFSTVSKIERGCVAFHCEIEINASYSCRTGTLYGALLLETGCGLPCKIPRSSLVSVYRSLWVLRVILMMGLPIS